VFLLHRKKRRCLSLKISDDLLFSHRPILYHQSLQRTDFAPPPFTQLNSSFCAPFTHFTKKCLFPTYIYAIFTLSFGFLRPLFGLRPGATALPCSPRYVTALHTWWNYLLNDNAKCNCIINTTLRYIILG